MEKLKAYLQGKKKSEFAAKVGISEAFLSQILSGVRKPKSDKMFDIERVTEGEVPMQSWFKDKGK